MDKSLERGTIDVLGFETAGRELMLNGLKVLDVASFIAGPAAATVMADFGADVIKVESPGEGDPYRKRFTSMAI